MRDLLGLGDRELYQEDADGLVQWFVDVALFGREPWLLFTHKPTRYSLWIPDAPRVDRRQFHDQFGQRLLRTLMIDGFDHRGFERLFRSEFRFAKTNDRSILGTMGDHIYCSDGYLEAEPELALDIGLLNSKLNRTPVGGIVRGQLEYPVEVLRNVVHPSGSA